MDYIISSLSDLTIPNGATNLVFEESVELPSGWKAELKDNVIYLLDANGKVQALYEKPVFEDTPSNEAVNNEAVNRTGSRDVKMNNPSKAQDSKTKGEDHKSDVLGKIGDYTICPDVLVTLAYSSVYSQYNYEIQIESFNDKQPKEVLDDISQYIEDYNRHIKDGVFFFESKVLYTEENFYEIAAATGYTIKEFEIISKSEDEQNIEKE